MEQQTPKSLLKTGNMMENNSVWSAKPQQAENLLRFRHRWLLMRNNITLRKEKKKRQKKTDSSLEVAQGMMS